MMSRYGAAESWRNMLYDSLGERQRHNRLALHIPVPHGGRPRHGRCSLPAKEAALRAASVASDSDSYLEWWER